MDSLVRRYRRRIVNSLLEYFILAQAERGRVCGYDMISILYDRFHVLLSPGQVYPVINYLVAHGVVVKHKDDRRRGTLALTPLGESLLKAWRRELNSINTQLNSVALVTEL